MLRRLIRISSALEPRHILMPEAVDDVAPAEIGRRRHLGATAIDRSRKYCC
jgi:hypothetical protein